jgi:hypothetical protein
MFGLTGSEDFLGPNFCSKWLAAFNLLSMCGYFGFSPFVAKLLRYLLSRPSFEDFIDLIGITLTDDMPVLSLDGGMHKGNLGLSRISLMAGIQVFIVVFL